jgi:hypothetical protein
MSVNITTDAAAFAEKTYDFLVIGGGTAGLALASRCEPIFWVIFSWFV